MASVFQKLNLRDQKEIVVLNAPESFEDELAGLRDVAIRRALTGVKQIEFSLAFVTRQSEVDAFARSIGVKASGDPVVWFAYPKGSSKNYKCEFNRDTGWDAVGKQGLEPVRMVAIDEDWSALRFRRVEFIKNLTRGRAVSPQAKARLTRAKK
ncbi:MAG TPA: hypothetical protein VKT49_01880 [Bryobacteraceae bacterium]|nr:hypothetical protein [Bryobacteraceae bacterium]